MSNAPTDSLDEVLSLATEVFDAFPGRLRLVVGRVSTEVVTVDDEKPPVQTVLLVAQRRVPVPVKPDASTWTEEPVDLHYSVAAALVPRADAQLRNRETEVATAQRALDVVTRKRDAVAARRARLVAIRDEGIARARAARAAREG